MSCFSEKLTGVVVMAAMLGGCAGSVKATPEKFSAAMGEFEQTCKPHFSNFDKMMIGAKFSQAAGKAPRGMHMLTSTISAVKSGYATAQDSSTPLQERFDAIKNASGNCRQIAMASEMINTREKKK